MITSKGARNLLKDVQFPGDVDSTYPIALCQQRRRELVQCGTGSRDILIAAAIEIQRFWRGFRTRCKLWAILGSLRSADVSSPLRCVPSSSSSRAHSKSPRQLYPKLAVRYRDYVQWCVAQGLTVESKAMLSFKEYAVQVIQSWWKHLIAMRKQGEKAEGVDVKKVFDEHSAATVIQRAWRKHNDIKVFQFYRDLINFQGQGSPSLMLRCINPSESRLLDQASGAFVRFRLGGIKFPPNIYYKIFTHQPIIDVCAFSPRNYTTMELRRQLGRERHNRAGRTLHKAGDGNWYSRVENNGWRLVSDRIFLSPFQDPITTETSAAIRDFHYSKLQRRQDADKKRKERKLEWMKKMYREGALRAKQGLELEGHESVEETDIDELLSWTNGLNYDQYLSEWQDLASTAASDDKIADAELF